MKKKIKSKIGNAIIALAFILYFSLIVENKIDYFIAVAIIIAVYNWIKIALLLIDSKDK
jgi:hypothetical protein